ncbi:hypothetical protein [Paenibacillus sp. HW567]|uniref:hypothetical protein n=1 Tax=Paenibacillus sp. HW567 TaxID=1034769 RepID=UPI0003A98487|nr:hypothetical protein [Paenibacillus sp. HW567]
MLIKSGGRRNEKEDWNRGYGLNGQQADSVKALKYEGSLYLSVKSMTDFFGLNSTLKYDSVNWMIIRRAY